VRRSPCGVRSVGIGLGAALGERLVRRRDGGPEDSVADVGRRVLGTARVAAAGAGRGEDERVGVAVGARGGVGEQLVAQDREEVHGPLGGGGLDAADVERPARQVEVAPAEVERLPDAEPGEDEDGEERAPPRRRPASLVAVEVPGGVEERGDVLGAVEVGASRLGGVEPAPLPIRGVAGDVLVLDGDLQDRGERLDELVDARRGEAAAGDLPATEAVHLLDGDRVEPERTELPEVTEPPQQVRAAARAEPAPVAPTLRAEGAEPVARELRERRHLPRLRLGRALLRRDPQATLNVREEVAGRRLGLLGRRRVERDVVALAAVAEAHPVARDLPGRLRAVLVDLARRLPSHSGSSRRFRCESRGRAQPSEDPGG